MLIDSTHKKWFVVTLLLSVGAVALYFWLRAQAPAGELKGGSFVGQWYGIAGASLMVYAGLLSALRKVPSWWWLGPRKTWLRGHIWLGTLSLVFILCHSGFSWGGPIMIALWITFIGVLVTGVFGLILQQLLPGLLAARVNCEAPYEQIPHLCQAMRKQADALVDEVCGAYDPRPTTFDNTVAVVQYAGNARAQLRDFYEKDMRPFLAAQVPWRSPLRNPLQAEARFNKLRRLPGLADVSEEVDKLARFCEERRLLQVQERIHFWLHVWLLVHVPLALALLVIGVTHVITGLRAQGL